MRASRRDFLQRGALASMGLFGAGLFPNRVKVRTPARMERWSFIHYTDVHVQPEPRGDAGYQQAVRAMNHVKLEPALAIAGGDLVFDVF
jgi:hypothetical protein